MYVRPLMEDKCLTNKKRFIGIKKNLNFLNDNKSRIKHITNNNKYIQSN